MKLHFKLFCSVIVILTVVQLLNAASAKQLDMPNQQLFPFWSIQNNTTKLCGFINQSGKVIIRPKYSAVCPFSDGVSWVNARDKWLLIDTAGKVLIDNPYIKNPSQFKDNICEVETTSTIGNSSTKNRVFIDKKGTVLFKKLYYDDIGSISDGLMYYCKGEEYNSNYSEYGFIDKNGNLVISPKYYKVLDFSEGLAAVSIRNQDNQIVSGYIDKNDREVIKFKYDYVGNFINGYAPIATVDDKFSTYNNGIIKTVNVDDSTIFPSSFLLYQHSENNKNKLQIDNIWNPKSLYGFINKNGNTIIEPQYDGIQYFQEDYFAACLNGNWGFIDKYNNRLTEFKFSDAHSFKNGFAAVLVTDDYGVNKWGFINKSGGIVINPKFDQVGDFNNGLAAVKTNDKWGFINSKGSYVIKPIYTDVCDFRNGLAFVEYKIPAKPLNENWGAYINTSGKVIWKSKW